MDLEQDIYRETAHATVRAHMRKLPQSAYSLRRVGLLRPGEVHQMVQTKSVRVQPGGPAVVENIGEWSATQGTTQPRGLHR